MSVPYYYEYNELLDYDCKYDEFSKNDVLKLIFDKLQNVHTLNLSYCTGITDVSALGKVENLNLSFCYRITDVSALGKVKNLHLLYCTSITDVSALGKRAVIICYERIKRR